MYEHEPHYTQLEGPQSDRCPPLMVLRASCSPCHLRPKVHQAASHLHVSRHVF